MKNFRDITEVKSKSATFTFGRFNPPTVGHMKLAKKMQSVSSGSDVKIFTSHGSDKKKNPLTHSQKIKFMNPMLPRGVNVSNSTSRTVFDVVTTLYDEGYREVQMVVGSDRIREFDSLLKKYNGVKARHGYYKFDSIQVVSAGQRDPDAEGDVGMSASKMRQFASLSQEKEFLDALPKGYRLGKQLYKAVQKGMGITEEFEDYMYEIMTEDNPRIPRKKGQPKGSDSHSDLYTDENPKGTIKGLKFATVEDAEKAFASQPTDLMRKEGKVTVSVRTDKGKREYTMEIACEKVLKTDGYFIALAKNCSPFRTAWLKLHGWKNKARQIEGRPQEHRALPKTTPKFVKEEKDQVTLGDALLSQNPGATSILDMLKDGPITLN